MDPFNQTIIESHRGQPIVIMSTVVNVINNHFNPSFLFFIREIFFSIALKLAGAKTRHVKLNHHNSEDALSQRESECYVSKQENSVELGLRNRLFFSRMHAVEYY